MINRTASLLALAVLTAIALPAASPVTDRNPGDPIGVVAHEWGTFTTVAGEDGRAIEWLPLGGRSDLPCFVDRLKGVLIKGLWGAPRPLDYGAARANLWGKVRMETPVIYFYSQQDASVDVRVRFPRGLMTEWYPRASVSQPLVHPATLQDAALVSEIAWNAVRILPDAKPDLPREQADSHYYPARETDAAPLQVGHQFEKFLFYRGVAGFDVPIAARALDDGSIHVRNLGAEPLEGVVLFENRKGRIGYRLHGTLRREAQIQAPALTGDFEILRASLERTLVGAGLYPREASAMVETWRDSWFEEGVRVLYLLPARAVETILPLSIQPAPRQIARAFVGRMELVTPSMVDAVDAAIRDGDAQTLNRYARFLGPITDRLLVQRASAADPRITAVTNAAFARYAASSVTCQQESRP